MADNQYYGSFCVGNSNQDSYVYLTLKAHNGTPFEEIKTVDKLKCAINITSGCVIARADNDHPIKVDGGVFQGIHEHVFKGSTEKIIPHPEIATVYDFGSFVNYMIKTTFPGSFISVPNKFKEKTG